MRRFLSRSRKRATTLGLIFAVGGGLAITSVAQQEQQQQTQPGEQQRQASEQNQASEQQNQQGAEQQQQRAQQQQNPEQQQQQRAQQQQNQQQQQQARQQQSQQDAEQQQGAQQGAQFQFNESAFRDAELASFEMAYPTGDRDTSVLLIEQRAPRQIAVGQPYQYELQVTNLTDEPLAGVTVVQNLGEQMEFDGSDLKAETPQQGQQRWKIGELEGGDSKTIRVSAIPTQEGASGVCVAVLYEPAMCSVVEIVKPSLRLTKQGPEQAYICEDVTYTYTVSNTGTGVAEGVTIIDELPSGLQTEAGENQVRFEVGSLDAGQSQDFNVQLSPSETGVFASRARAESNVDTARSEEVQTEIIQADLRVNVTGPEWEYTDRPVTYEVEVTNVGKYTARDTVLTVVTDRLADDQQARQRNQQQPGQSQGQQQSNQQQQGQSQIDQQAKADEQQQMRDQEQQAGQQQQAQAQGQQAQRDQQQQARPQQTQQQAQAQQEQQNQQQQARAQQNQQQQAQAQQEQQNQQQQAARSQQGQQQQAQAQGQQQQAQAQGQGQQQQMREQQQQQQAQQNQQQLQQRGQEQPSQQRIQQARQIQGDQDQRRIGDLEPGQTERFNITLPGGTQAETIRIAAQATSICEVDADDEAIDLAQTEIRTLPALLLEMVDNEDPVRIGDNTTYIITVKNQGTGIATGVVISAELPQELEYVSATGDTEVQSEGQNEIQFRPIDLAPGEVAMWNVEAKANAPADIRMRVEMDSEFLTRAVPEVEPTRLVESGD